MTNPGQRVTSLLLFLTALFLASLVQAQTIISLTPDRSDAQLPVFAPVTWTAIVTGGTGALTYQFWRFDATTGWSLAQDYGTSNSYTWTPTLADSGEHALQVWVRNAGSVEAYDAWAGTGFFTVATPTVTLNPSAPGQVGAGSTLTWTATLTGLYGAQIQFWRYDIDGWHLAQPYSNYPAYTWTTTSADRGDHAVQVWVKSSFSSAPYDAWAGTGLFPVVEPQPIVPSAPSALSNLPARAGVPLTFVAPATGGIQPLEYQFWRFDSNVGWTKVQDYGPSSTYTWWTPGVRDVGSHALQAWVRSMGSTAPYEAWSGTGLFEVGCPAITLTAYDNAHLSDLLSYPSDQPPPSYCSSQDCPLGDVAFLGQPFTISASVCGGTGEPLEYQFRRVKIGVTDWEIVQDFGGPDTFTWTPSALPGDGAAGFYGLDVRTRRVGFGSITAYESRDTKTVSLRQPAADLDVSITSPPILARAGSTAILTYVITNIGPVSRNVSACNSTYSIDAVVVGSRPVPLLAPGASTTESVTLTLPPTPGAYYLTVQHDCSPDLNYLNDRRSIAVRILP